MESRSIPRHFAQDRKKLIEILWKNAGARFRFTPANVCQLKGLILFFQKNDFFSLQKSGHSLQAKHKLKEIK